jgi:hypothetical protein
VDRFVFVLSDSYTECMSFLSSLIPIAHAAGVSITPVGAANGNSGASADTIINAATQNIIKLLFLIGGSLAVIFILFSGVQYISAGGDPEKAKKARIGIINAVIGIIIMMATFFIIRLAVGVGKNASVLDQPGAVNGTQSSDGSDRGLNGSTQAGGNTTNSSGNTAVQMDVAPAST